MNALNLSRYHPSLLEQDLGKHGRLGSEFQREVLQDEESFISYLNSFDLKDQFVGEDGKLTLKNLPPDAETFLLLLHRRLNDRQIQNLIYAPPRQGGGIFDSSRRYTDQIFSAGAGNTSTTTVSPQQRGPASSAETDATRREAELTDLLMDLRDDFFDAILIFGGGTDEQKLESVFTRLENSMAQYKRPNLKQQFNTLVMDDPRAGKYGGTASIEEILTRELSGRELGRMTALATLPDSHALLMASYNTATYQNIVRLAGSRQNISGVFSGSVSDIQKSNLSPELKAAVMDLASDVERLGQEAYEAGIFGSPPPDREMVIEKEISISDLLLLKNIYGQVAFQIEEMRNLAATMDGVSDIRRRAPMEEFERARTRLNSALTNIHFMGGGNHEYKNVMRDLQESTGSMLREALTFKMQEGFGLSSFEATARAGEMGSYVAIGVLVTTVTMGAMAPALGATTSGMAGLSELTFAQAATAGGAGVLAGGTAQTVAHYSAVRFGGSEEMSLGEIARGAYTEQFKTAVGLVTGTQIGRAFVAAKSIQTESRLAQTLQRLAVENGRVSGTIEGITSNVALGSMYIVTDQVGFSMDHEGNFFINENILALWALSGALNRGAFGGLDDALMKQELRNTWRGIVGSGSVVSKDLTLEAGEEILETLLQEGYITPDQVLQSSMAAMQELGTGGHIGGEASRQHQAALQHAMREHVESLNPQTEDPPPGIRTAGPHRAESPEAPAEAATAGPSVAGTAPHERGTMDQAKLDALAREVDGELGQLSRGELQIKAADDLAMSARPVHLRIGETPNEQDLKNITELGIPLLADMTIAATYDEAHYLLTWDENKGYYRLDSSSDTPLRVSNQNSNAEQRVTRGKPIYLMDGDQIVTEEDLGYRPWTFHHPLSLMPKALGDLMAQKNQIVLRGDLRAGVQDRADGSLEAPRASLNQDERGDWHLENTSNRAIIIVKRDGTSIRLNQGQRCRLGNGDTLYAQVDRNGNRIPESAYVFQSPETVRATPVAKATPQPTALRQRPGVSNEFKNPKYKIVEAHLLSAEAKRKVSTYGDIFINEPVAIHLASGIEKGWVITQLNDNGTVDLRYEGEGQSRLATDTLHQIPLDSLDMDMTTTRGSGAIDEGWQPAGFNSEGTLLLDKTEGSQPKRRASLPKQIRSTNRVHEQSDQTTALRATHPGMAFIRYAKRLLATDHNVFPERDFQLLFRGDPQQANVGNCWLVAAFHSLRHAGLFEVFIRTSMRKTGPGTYEVRIPIGSRDGKWIQVSPADITAQQNLNRGQQYPGRDMVDDRTSLHPVMGPMGYAILEAAYMKAVFGRIDRADLHGGYGGTALSNLFSKNVIKQQEGFDHLNNVLGSNRLIEERAESYLNQFDNRIDMATVATPHKSGDDTRTFNIDGIKFHYNHAYAIESVDKDAKAVVVANPHGKKITLTYDQFMRAFSIIDAVRLDYNNLFDEFEGLLRRGAAPVLAQAAWHAPRIGTQANPVSDNLIVPGDMAIHAPVSLNEFSQLIPNFDSYTKASPTLSGLWTQAQTAGQIKIEFVEGGNISFDSSANKILVGKDHPSLAHAGDFLVHMGHELRHAQDRLMLETRLRESPNWPKATFVEMALLAEEHAFLGELIIADQLKQAGLHPGISIAFGGSVITSDNIVTRVQSANGEAVLDGIRDFIATEKLVSDDAEMTYAEYYAGLYDQNQREFRSRSQPDLQDISQMLSLDGETLFWLDHRDQVKTQSNISRGVNYTYLTLNKTDYLRWRAAESRPWSRLSFQEQQNLLAQFDTNEVVTKIVDGVHLGVKTDHTQRLTTTAELPRVRTPEDSDFSEHAHKVMTDNPAFLSTDQTAFYQADFFKDAPPPESIFNYKTDETVYLPINGEMQAFTVYRVHKDPVSNKKAKTVKIFPEMETSLELLTDQGALVKVQKGYIDTYNDPTMTRKAMTYARRALAGTALIAIMPLMPVLMLGAMLVKAPRYLGAAIASGGKAGWVFHKGRWLFVLKPGAGVAQDPRDPYDHRGHFGKSNKYYHQFRKLSGVLDVMDFGNFRTHQQSIWDLLIQGGYIENYKPPHQSKPRRDEGIVTRKFFKNQDGLEKELAALGLEHAEIERVTGMLRQFARQRQNRPRILTGEHVESPEVIVRSDGTIQALDHHRIYGALDFGIPISVEPTTDETLTFN